MITSLSSEQPQPSTEFYGLEVLQLVKTHARVEYEDAGGPLIAFDPSRPEQNWWIDGAAAKPFSYSGLVQPGDGSATIKSFVSPDPSKPNFKGIPNWPEWNPAPTVAVQPRMGGVVTAVNRVDLSTADEAQSMLAEIGGVKVIDAGADAVTIPGFGTIVQPINYGVEARRVFDLVLANGNKANVGQLLANKYRYGIGRPGRWVPDTGQVSGLHWEATPISAGSEIAADPLPPPCRQLKANEQIVVYLASPFNKASRIHRNDIAPAAGTGTDAEILRDIQAKVTAIYNLVIPH